MLALRCQNDKNRPASGKPRNHPPPQNTPQNNKKSSKKEELNRLSIQGLPLQGSSEKHYSIQCFESLVRRPTLLPASVCQTSCAVQGAPSSGLRASIDTEQRKDNKCVQQHTQTTREHAVWVMVLKDGSMNKSSIPNQLNTSFSGFRTSTRGCAKMLQLVRRSTAHN
eukprot:3735913-Amphidinium_carterae.1